MSDADLGNAGEAPVESGGAPVETTTAPVTTQTGNEPDPFESGADTFPREYVERIRREAADHRVQANRYKEAFDGYSDDEVNALLGLTKTLSSDPRTAASQMQQIIDNINELYPEEQAPVDDGTGDKPLTRAEYEALRQQEESNKQMDKAMRSIEDKAGSLGYKPGTPEYIDLLWRANNQTNFDLDKAHEAIQSDRQKVIDDYLAAKANDANGSPSHNGSGGPAGEVHQDNSWDAAKARVQARLNATPGQ